LAVEEGLGVVFDNDVVSELVLDSVWHEKVWVYSRVKGACRSSHGITKQLKGPRGREATEITVRRGRSKEK
jgi:hypothetical protein